jgi:hypothetical protein
VSPTSVPTVRLQPSTATKPFGSEAGRALDVHRVADPQRAERGEAQGLVDHVERDLGAGLGAGPRHDREAGPGDRDRRAHREIPVATGRERDAEPAQTRAVAHGPHLSPALDDPGEHGAG